MNTKPQRSTNEDQKETRPWKLLQAKRTRKYCYNAGIHIRGPCGNWAHENRSAAIHSLGLHEIRNLDTKISSWKRRVKFCTCSILEVWSSYNVKISQFGRLFLRASTSPVHMWFMHIRTLVLIIQFVILATHTFPRNPIETRRKQWDENVEYYKTYDWFCSVIKVSQSNPILLWRPKQPTPLLVLTFRADINVRFVQVCGR